MMRLLGSHSTGASSKRLIHSSVSKVPLVLEPKDYATLPGSVIPVDVSWHMPGSQRKPEEEWTKKRLPRARFLDLDTVADRSHPLSLPHMMPQSAAFAQACSSLGIAPSSHVVFYDSVGVFSSPRALFMFKAFGHDRASILNGGLPAYEYAGYPVEEGSIYLRIAATEYLEPKLDMSFIKSYQDIQTNLGLSVDDPTREIILDARPRGRFNGTSPEPRPGMSSGHMPGSLSLPFDELRENVQASDGAVFSRLKSTEQLNNIFENLLGPDKPPGIVNTCGSGMSAAIIWLALQQLGIKSSVYDESWMGYASRSESIIESMKG